MRNLDVILNKLFFNENSPRGLAKKEVLSGLSDWGRICVMHFPDRKYPYRINASDITNFKVNLWNLIELNKNTPNREEITEEFRKEVQLTGATDMMSLALEVMPYVSINIADMFPDLITNEELFGIIKTCQFEVFLVGMDNPMFIVEIFPEFDGVDTDNHFGSNFSMMIPVEQYSDHQRSLGPGRMELNMFGALAFNERLSQFENNDLVKSDTSEGSFSPLAQEKVMEEWLFNNEPWLIKEPRHQFKFFGNFMTELAHRNGWITKSIHIEDAAAHFTGKNAKIIRK